MLLRLIRKCVGPGTGQVYPFLETFAHPLTYTPFCPLYRRCREVDISLVGRGSNAVNQHASLWRACLISRGSQSMELVWTGSLWTQYPHTLPSVAM